jgi:DUF1680 family protein
MVSLDLWTGISLKLRRIEAACYFLSTPDGRQSPYATEFDKAIDELISMMAKAQQPDGYLGTYFTVVDKAGRLKNLRDMHELCKPVLTLVDHSS